MAVRIIGLARTGCRQDITSECFLLQSLTQPEVNPDQPRSAVDDYLLACERQCAINRKSCFEAATTYLDRGERLKARNAIEASCQFSDNGYLREKACLDLEVFYESQSFPEPVGHRARELSAWRCKQRRDHGEDSCD
jgi:hypothetical protein